MQASHLLRARAHAEGSCLPRGNKNSFPHVCLLFTAGCCRCSLLFTVETCCLLRMLLLLLISSRLTALQTNVILNQQKTLPPLRSRVRTVLTLSSLAR